MNSLKVTLQKPVLVFAILTISYGTSFAEQQEVVQFDPATTKIDFILGDILHAVHGTFRLKSGEIRFDPTTGTASGALAVDAGSDWMTAVPSGDAT